MEAPSATINVNLIANNKKIATHSHIKGLGLKDDGYAEPIASGFVGQAHAREVH
jgi:RuvB-like protein 1